MWPPHIASGLSSLLLLISACLADQGLPTAIKRQSPDSGAKILPEHLAFAPIPILLPTQRSSFADYNEREEPTERFYPAYGSIPDLSQNAFRRAAGVVNILHRKSACPPEMSSCADIGSPNKCCQQGTYCTEVPDTDVGRVACCPEGQNCGGGVGKCPAEAVSCPARLGGGCCIRGYVCQGVGCIAESKVTSTKTKTARTTSQRGTDTVTTTQTTEIKGKPTTVIATVTIIRTEEGDTETKTVTEEITESAGAPYRPTLTSSQPSSSASSSSEAKPSSEDQTTTESTQTGCPTGFYGCLATHGGGCCRTNRDCETFDCPAPTSTTVVSDGATVVVPATNLPDPTSATCADGWFLCGKDAGPRAGCCPDGYGCGTASCFVTGTQGGEKETGSVAKVLPGDEDAAGALAVDAAMLGLVITGVVMAVF